MCVIVVAVVAGGRWILMATTSCARVCLCLGGPLLPYLAPEEAIVTLSLSYFADNSARRRGGSNAAVRRALACAVIIILPN